MAGSLGSSPDLEEAGALTKQQEIEFRKMFVTLDTDKDGRLSAAEVVTGIRALRLTPTEAETQILQQDIVENYGGLVDFEEFCLHTLRFVKEDEDPESVLRRAFRIWDKELNGLISAEALKTVMLTLGEVLPEDEINEFMKEANPDQAGMVNYEDFIIKLTTGYCY